MVMSINVLDLFSGIGGFSLGLERAGMRTVAFCEIERYCRAVLRKHWPAVPIFEDARKLSAADIPAPIDVICGGFPCQDISLAGNGAGINGARSGLWREYARLVGELRPRFVIVENVAALLGRGLGVVLGDLAALGFDAEWHCIPASSIGAPHRRDRVWVIANATDKQNSSKRNDGSRSEYFKPKREIGGSDLFVGGQATHWRCQPGIRGVVDGIPPQVDRIAAIGNAVVPQIPEIIGRAIMREIDRGS